MRMTDNTTILPKWEDINGDGSNLKGHSFDSEVADEIAKANREKKPKVPFGLKKSEYQSMLRLVQKEIDERKEKIREHGEDSPTGYWHQLIKEEFIEKKKDIKKRLEWAGKYIKNDIDIAKAKSYPIDQILDFKRGKNHICLWHNDNNPSLHYDKKRNKVHCFSCGVDKDSIDVFMAINGVDFIRAVKALS